MRISGMLNNALAVSVFIMYTLRRAGKKPSCTALEMKFTPFIPTPSVCRWRQQSVTGLEESEKIPSSCNEGEHCGRT